MRYISDLHEGDQVSEIYLCKTKSPGTSKFGKSYYSLTLQDKTGMIDGKVWELTNAIGHFEAMDYILVRGQVTSYQGSNQLNIQQIRKAQEGEFDMADYMPSTKKDIDGMFKELLAMISGEKILQGETLIIFDEIQECPEALNALKYFKEKARADHVIAAGSLLGTLLAKPKSYPVGMVNLLDLYP